MNIQVKCYLFANSSAILPTTLSQPSEIRRFAIHTDTNENVYKIICDKIRIAYGSLIKPNDEIKTYWIDEENDLVCFSTDEESIFAIDMQTAIYCSKNSNFNPVFKIYVAIKKANEPSNQQARVHPGVLCDGCNGSISGNRYTCVSCPDYDLCSNCRNKGIHQEHEFIVFDKPVKQRCPFGRQRRFHGGFNKNCPNKNQQANSSNNNAQNAFSNIFPLISNAVPMVNDPDALKNFGEHLKSFLDPFGIDVSYYIDSNQKKQEKENNHQNKEEKKGEEEQKTSNETETLIDLSKKVKLETCVSNESLQNQPFENRPEQAEIKSSLESAANTLKDAIDNQNFVELSEKEEEKSENTTETDDNGFNVVDIEKEMKYIKCVEQLTNMGYSDEAGWLSRLVIAKDGNINNVLDALQPSK